MKKIILLFIPILLFGCNQTEELHATIKNTYETDSIEIQATVTESVLGIFLRLEGGGLSEGAHAMHIHEFGSCEELGDAAGGHYDPENTEKTHGEYLGQLPKIDVDPSGYVFLETQLTKALKLSNIKDRAIVIHETSNHPERPGARIACGVFSQN